MIAFYTDEGIKPPKIAKTLLKRWLRSVVERYEGRVGDLHYQFCSDERILEVNREFLQHDYYTDIITFDETQGSRISGDMLISLDTVASNAEMLGVSMLDELHRVMVHGVLHLIGLGDKTPEEQQKMRAAEDEALKMLRDMMAE